LSPIFWYKIANAATEVEGNGSGFLGKPYEPNAVIKNDVEYILIFRKPDAYRAPTPEQRALSVIERSDHERWFRQVWTDIPGQVRLQGHPAPYQLSLSTSRLARIDSDRSTSRLTWSLFFVIRWRVSPMPLTARDAGAAP
jgi:hypothetical protein